MDIKKQYIEDKFSIYNGDSAEVLKGLPENSIDFMIYSPPFADLFTYSNSERDLGNCRNYDDFFTQFEFIAKELLRTLKPGRLMSVHCMDLPTSITKDGFIGLRDFPGDLTRMFTKIGFIYFSKVTIWKDPLLQATRSHTKGLLHKELVKDSSSCQQGLSDYLITFKKKGSNEEFISHPEGLKEYYGSNPPENPKVLSHEIWRKYASPVWSDVRQTLTLNGAAAREEKDEKHICPLQLDTIARAVELWSNPNDIVLTPFLGIGSELYQSLLMGRRGIGIELKSSYFEQAYINCKNAVSKTEKQQVTFADL